MARAADRGEAREQDHSAPDVRDALRVSRKAEALTARWIYEHAGEEPPGAGSVWWPVDYINAELEAEGDVWRVQIEEGELMVVPAPRPIPWWRRLLGGGSGRSS